MPYWRLHYHAAWACKNRESSILPRWESELYKYLQGKGANLGAIVHAAGGIENHVHIVFSLPPQYALADFIGQLKGASSHWINHFLNNDFHFEWQNGYGVFSFGDKAMKSIVKYVQNQKEHHKNNTIIPGFERWNEDNEVQPTPKC